MPSADFCVPIRLPCSSLSPQQRDRTQISRGKSDRLHRTPAGSTALALDGSGLRDQLSARPTKDASCPVSVRQVAALIHASSRPRLATPPLRFTSTSPPSSCAEDFHLQAVRHARHTTKPSRFGIFTCGSVFKSSTSFCPTIPPRWRTQATTECHKTADGRPRVQTRPQTDIPKPAQTLDGHTPNNAPMDGLLWLAGLVALLPASQLEPKQESEYPHACEFKGGKVAVDYLRRSLPTPPGTQLIPGTLIF